MIFSSKIWDVLKQQQGKTSWSRKGLKKNVKPNLWVQKQVSYGRKLPKIGRIEFTIVSRIGPMLWFLNSVLLMEGLLNTAFWAPSLSLCLFGVI